jgi:hypothetical protein
MSDHEKQECERLNVLWATGKATKSQMLKCMELDKKAEHEARSK